MYVELAHLSSLTMIRGCLSGNAFEVERSVLIYFATPEVIKQLAVFSFPGCESYALRPVTLGFVS